MERSSQSLVRISDAASLAMHAMALLARHQQKRFTTDAVAKCLNASRHHLAKVMQRLGRAGLVKSVRGPCGGFCLAVPAVQIPLLAIYEAIEGSMAQSGCLLSKPVCEGAGCALGELVRALHGQVRDYLTKTSLDEFSRCAALAQTSRHESLVPPPCTVPDEIVLVQRPQEQG